MDTVIELQADIQDLVSYLAQKGISHPLIISHERGEPRIIHESITACDRDGTRTLAEKNFVIYSSTPIVWTQPPLSIENLLAGDLAVIRRWAKASDWQSGDIMVMVLCQCDNRCFTGCPLPLSHNTHIQIHHCEWPAPSDLQNAQSAIALLRQPPVCHAA